MATISTLQEIVEEPHEDEAVLDSNHPKLLAFQLAVKAALSKRIQEADEEIQRLRKENADKQRARQLQTSKLHDAQRELKLEQKKVADLDRDLEEVVDKRTRLDLDNEAKKQDLEDLTVAYLKAKAKNERLKLHHNRVLANQILLTTRRVKTAGDVNATQTSATKAEEDYKKLQNEKQAQDLYLNKITQDMEDINQQISEYNEQADAMKQQSAETIEMVRKAEIEIERIHQEKKNIMQKWTSTVINIAKRDEALVSFRNALKNQELALKGTKAEIEGTKQEIITCQEKHDHLTTISRRAQRLCANKKASIRKNEDLIEETKVDLQNAEEAKEKTLEALEEAKADMHVVQKDLASSAFQIGKLEQVRRQLEEDVMNLSRDAHLSDKNAHHQVKLIKSVREKAKLLEERLSDVQNQMTGVLQDIMQTSLVIDQQDVQISDLDMNISNLNFQLDTVIKGINKAQATIDKKQNEIDMKTKEKEELVEAKEGGALSPLEAEIARTKEELSAVESHCQEAKQQWLKYQNEFITKVDEKSVKSEVLRETNRKHLVMEQKNHKLQSEIVSMERALVELKRRLEVKDGVIMRLNKQFFEEKQRYAEDVKVIEGKRALEVNKMQLLLEQVEATKEEVRQLAKEVENEKLSSNSAAEELSQWEELVRNCKESQEALQMERSRQGELEALRSDLHRMQVRAEQVEKQTRMLMGAIEEYVDRRETLVDKVTTLATSRTINTTPQMIKSLLTKKIEDLNFKLKRMTKEETNIQKKLTLAKEDNDLLKQENEKKQMAFEQMRSLIIQKMQEADLKRNHKDLKLNQILRLQTRAKWYRAIKVKRYRPTNRDEAQSATELTSVLAQNEDLKGAVAMLIQSCPDLRKNITKAMNMIG